MYNEVRYLLRKRDRCFKRYKRTLSEQDKFRFYLARREINRAKRNATYYLLRNATYYLLLTKKKFNDTMVSNSNKPNLSTRDFWKISEGILGDKSDHNIPPLLHNKNLVSDEDNKSIIRRAFKKFAEKCHHFFLFCKSAELNYYSYKDKHILYLCSKFCCPGMNTMVTAVAMETLHHDYRPTFVHFCKKSMFNDDVAFDSLPCFFRQTLYEQS